MTDAPITLMQDGAWLVDAEGYKWAMPVPGGVYAAGVVLGPVQLRALVAWLEQQEASRER